MAIAPETVSPPPPGLTTTKAPFIEEARAHGDIYIHQPYELYSAENQATWGKLIGRMQDRWERYANERFLEGLDKLQLSAARIPRLDEINRFLQALTGFRARPVSGYVPVVRLLRLPAAARVPDDDHDPRRRAAGVPARTRHLSRRRGHVPMHTDPAFAQALVRFGECAASAARRASAISDEHEKLRRLTSNIRAMSRFFWFSIEFGLMRSARSGDGLKVYGSGLLSSFGEIAHAIDSPDVQRFPFQIEWVINQGFEIDHYQPLLYVVDSFDHLFALVTELEQCLLAGKLDNVAPGDPEVSETDLASFLHGDKAPPPVT